jgi:hypothetical protein
MARDGGSYMEREEAHRAGDSREERLPVWVRERLGSLRSMVRFAERELEESQRALAIAGRAGVPGDDVAMYVMLNAPLDDSHIPLPPGSTVVIRLANAGELNVGAIEARGGGRAHHAQLWSDGPGSLHFSAAAPNSIIVGVLR